MLEPQPGTVEPDDERGLGAYGLDGGEMLVEKLLDAKSVLFDVVQHLPAPQPALVICALCGDHSHEGASIYLVSRDSV